MGKQRIGKIISYRVELLRQISPSSVLDVGVGYGRWGHVLPRIPRCVARPGGKG
ncbi:hypothetical protein [Paenibacillus sp. MDMC362]|uniref:hypothetical protein n=1 Tax=Paenibacillus sp. MDMC362 TaxID=2977365 RepID=UPI0021A3CC5A|nr:hypothetical protein [Paenibacillus sp. MDMC362]